MATLRSDGRWMEYARIAPGPKGRKAVYGQSKEEATQAARDLEQASRQIDSPPPLPQWAPGSFAEFVYGKWVPHVYPRIRLTTQRSYDSILTHHVLPPLADLQISSIGYAEVKAAMDGMRKVGKDGAPIADVPLPDRRKNEAVMRIKEILAFYAKLQSAQLLPARTDWTLVTPPKRKRKKERIEPPQDFTEKILAACTGRFAWGLGPVFCGLFLGLRRGEIAGLMWSDINRADMTIRISMQRQREYAGRAPTKGETRDIPIVPSILEWIDRTGRKDSVFCFLGASNTPIPVDELSKLIPRLCAAAGLPKVEMHDLRSFAASNLIDMGVDLPLVMEILGHTEVDVTLLYVNRNREAKRKALAALLEKWTA